MAFSLEQKPLMKAYEISKNSLDLELVYDSY